MHYGGKTESLTPSVIGSSSSSSLLVGGRSLQINTEKRVALCSNNMLLTFTVQIYTKLNILWENLDVLDVLVSALHCHHQNTECRNMGENAAPTLQQRFRGIENKSHEELKLFNSVQFHLYWTITSKISDFIKGNPTIQQCLSEQAPEDTCHRSCFLNFIYQDKLIMVIFMVHFSLFAF